MDGSFQLRMDSSYPNVNICNFVTVKPCLEERSSFKIWKEQMLCLLESQDLVGFVDGEVQPPQNNSDEQKTWRRRDRLVKGWILGSIGKDELSAVWDKPTARDVWLELHNIFNHKSGENSKDLAIQEEQNVPIITLKNVGYSEENSNDLAIQVEHSDRESGLCGSASAGNNQPTYGERDYGSYLQLYQAAQKGDWETAKSFSPDINELGTTIISSELETPLHVAILNGKANDFVKNLVELMPANALALTDSNGDTALHNAAVVGNTEAAMLLVNKSPDLLLVLNNQNQLPVMRAALHSQKDTLKLLLSKSAESNLCEATLGITLLIFMIASEFLDVALDFVEKHPKLAVMRVEYGNSALSIIAAMDTLFPRLETFGWWENFIYHSVPSKKFKYEGASVAVRQKMEFMIWTAMEYLVPKLKKLRKMKKTHQQALQLAEYLCHQLLSSPQNEASAIFQTAIKNAAKVGNSEIVEMILCHYPFVAFEDVSNGTDVFQLAASNRFENIINLIYNMNDRKYLMYDCADSRGNNLMHICGKLAPSSRLNLVTGAALQMQRELQWFKEMEKFVHPSRRTWANIDGLSPQMIFTMEHANLKAEGERWMKDTANACTIAAALIATVMFAAAFTVPGGLRSDTGIPLFSEQPAFDLFAISDAISLFTAIYSLLMFISILTSRYAEEDFLYRLPKRLSIGLFSLFVSITFMMIAFAATLYLIFRRNGEWYQILLGAFACFPVTSFVLLQFPLLVDVVYSTCGPGIFGKKTGSFLYYRPCY